MVNSNKRADVVLYKGLYNVLTDVRTVANGDPRFCCAAALSPGHGAAWGAVQKNTAWLAQAQSQGDLFFALCHEAGGRVGRGCEIFLDQLCSVAATSQSERMAFRIYALQRLHAATFRGVAMLINSRPVMRTGPEVPQEASSLPVPPPAPAAGD